jgi:Kef-type K+ transport system membrane component KefB
LHLLLKQIKVPSIISQILAGLLLGIPIVSRLLFDATSLIALDVLSTLGVVFLLFLAGLEIDMKLIRDTAKTSVLIGTAATLTPLLLGVFALLALGYTLAVAIVFGIALSVTAGGTIVGTLMDSNAVNTKLGAIFVAAGTIDDILEVTMLSIVTLLIQGGGVIQLALLPLQLFVFIAVSLVLFKFLTKFMVYVKVQEEPAGHNVELFSVAIIILIGMSALSELLAIGYLIGAVIAGFLLQNSIKKIGEHRGFQIVNATRLIALAFIVPFFFANIGLNFNIEALLDNPSLTVIAVAIAIGGAVIGTFITKPFTRLSFRQLYVIGWAMSAKGSVELVVALLAQRYGLLPPEIFNALVAMAIVTTLAFPLVLKREIRRYPALLNQ